VTSPTILVIDDEATILGVMASCLRHAGFQVETAATAEQAVAITRRDVPDLIISDVLMPDQEGPALITRLKHAGVACPVMFTSGDPSFRVVTDSLDVPGATFLPKPFTPREFVDAVFETLGQR
jgi:DNA-binding NtrC family response regulator